MRTRFAASAALFVMVVLVSAPWVESQSEADVPHYNAEPSKSEKLDPILTPDQLMGAQARHVYQTHAYELAAKIPKVIYQQPCYCYCDRNMGHNSLHSCFSSTHGSVCGTCLKELYYTYTMNKQGKTASQIRAGIVKGEWQSIDLEKSAAIE